MDDLIVWGKPTKKNVMAVRRLIRKYRGITEVQLRAAGSLMAITGLGSVRLCIVCQSVPPRMLMSVDEDNNISCKRCLHSMPREIDEDEVDWGYSVSSTPPCLLHISYGQLKHVNNRFSTGTASANEVIEKIKKRADYLESLVSLWEERQGNRYYLTEMKNGEVYES